MGAKELCLPHMSVPEGFFSACHSCLPNGVGFKFSRMDGDEVSYLPAEYALSRGDSSYRIWSVSILQHGPQEFVRLKGSICIHIVHEHAFDGFYSNFGPAVTVWESGG